MALSQSLSTGITGLMTHQTAMDNLGNNLANVNTTGFKKGVYQFSNLLQQSIRGGMAADASTGRGSVNPISMGMGAQTASINKVFTQGNLENTGNPYDVAINGNGFFVVRQGNGYAYTRDGSFFRGEDGHLMNYSGLYVQGTMAVRQSDGSYKIPADAKREDIVIPIGTIGGHSQTTAVEYAGNLNSSQEVSTGLNLYGVTSAPTTNNMQQWMPKANPEGKADETWNILEDGRYAVPRSVFANMSQARQNALNSNKNVTVYDDGLVTNLYSDNSYKCTHILITEGPVTVGTVTYQVGEVVSTQALFGQEYLSVTDARIAQGNPTVGIAVMREVNAINGGNVQTSAAFAVKVYDPVTGDYLGMEPATLDTDLKDLWYYKGTNWVQPFANIEDGDEIEVSFTKGEAKHELPFVYNHPKSKAYIPGQVSVDQEQSFTLEHFLTFMGGKVDDPTTMCQDITPAMFGATVNATYPAGDPTTMTDAQIQAYQNALANTKLATNDDNSDMVGGAMGLVSIPPRISDGEGGTDPYSSPAESAGVYTRTGVQTVDYEWVDPVTGNIERKSDPSFNVSFVSNLGAMNALGDIQIKFKDVPHESMFTAETQYAAEQGGSSMLTIDYYDSLGNPKSAVVRMAMVSQDNDFTTWRWYADCAQDSDNQWQADQNGNITTNLAVGTGLIRFDKDGNFVKGAEHSETNGITIDQRKEGVNNPIWIKVLNGLSSSSKQDLDFSRMTCTAKESDFKLYHQNGCPPGVLKEFAISEDGVIQGLYDNGNVVPLARIGLAQIPNETGLIAAGANLFYLGPSSGDALYGHAGTGGLGSLHQNQLETSNVELSVEFTKLITIERGFQANSRTITTADEMIQELLNLKR